MPRGGREEYSESDEVEKYTNDMYPMLMMVPEGSQTANGSAEVSFSRACVLETSIENRRNVSKACISRCTARLLM